MTKLLRIAAIAAVLTIGATARADLVPPGGRPPASRPSSRPSSIVVVAGAGAAVVLAGAGLWIIRSRRKG